MFWNNKSSRDRSAPSDARPSQKPAHVHVHVQKTSGLAVDAHSLKPVKPERNSDPYNTSGSFDRTKNWSRVGKR